MNKRGIKWLYQELPDLEAKGILTRETADNMRRYYGQPKGVTKTAIMLITLGTIGALLIGLGIILLFAHNWDNLSRFTRAGLSLAPLAAGQALALWVLGKRPQSGALKEGSAVFLSLMCGASIALIGQTYNIPQDSSAFILTWMLLIIPLVYFMQASIPAVIYLIGITSWAGTCANNPAAAVLFWPLAALTLPHFIWALRQEIYALRTALLSLVMVICVSFASGFSLGKTWPGSWVIIFPSLYCVFYFLGHLEVEGITANWQRLMRLTGELGLFILAFLFTFDDIWQSLDEYSYAAGAGGLSALPDYLVTMAVIAAAILLFYDELKRKNIITSLFGAIPLLAIIAYLARGQSGILPVIIFNVYLFILSVSRIISGARDNNLVSANIGMFILAVLIVVRFFDSEISFILKGLVFIAVGSGFLAANALLARRMRGAK